MTRTKNERRILTHATISYRPTNIPPQVTQGLVRIFGEYTGDDKIRMTSSHETREGERVIEVGLAGTIKIAPLHSGGRLTVHLRSPADPARTHLQDIYGRIEQAYGQRA